MGLGEPTCRIQSLSSLEAGKRDLAEARKGSRLFSHAEVELLNRGTHCWLSH